MLEDVLVPVYLMHRYQLEAVTKEIGGAYYSYALRGDGQVVTQPLPGAAQRAALHAVMDCAGPDALALPDRIIRLIPPRPSGYEYNPELFTHRTGLSFDPLGAAECGTDLAYSFLFVASRLNRLAQASRDNVNITEMVDSLVARTWRAPASQGLRELIRQQNGQMMLTYLLAASVDEQTSFAAKAQLRGSIDRLKLMLEGMRVKVKGTDDEGNVALALDRIKDPSKAKGTVRTTATPPGAPIGCEDEN